MFHQHQKRDHDQMGESNDVKRFRPDEILGHGGGDSIITRLLMGKGEFS